MNFSNFLFYQKSVLFKSDKKSDKNILDLNYDVICNSAQFFRIHTLQYFSIKILFKKSKLQFTFLDNHFQMEIKYKRKLLKQIKM